MKRQRGRGRKPGGGGGNYHNNNQGGGGGGGHYQPNRSLDSNGPETKVRGTASHINERYLQLARDASSSGDRVLSENYLQHADHYFRLWRSMQPAVPVQQQQNFNDGADYEGDDDGAQDGEGGEESEVRAEGGDQSEGEYQGDREREGGDRAEGDRAPRRGRNRRRFSPDGERQGGQEARDGESREPRTEGAEQPREARDPREQREFREPRRERDGGEPRRERVEGAEPRPPRRDRPEGEQPREPRRERQPREDRDAGSREGFSDGPKPAFLRGGGGNAE